MVSYRKRGKSWQFEISYKDTNGSYRKIRKSGYRLKSDAIIAASSVQVNNPKLITYLKGQQTLEHYFHSWIELYKKDIVADVTYIKYLSTEKHIKKFFNNIKLIDLTRNVYQEKINLLAQTHAKRTVSCFHKHIRACILDAIDENIIQIDPTRKAIITGRSMPVKHNSLNYEEWLLLLQNLRPLDPAEMMIYLASVTGMRYAEIAGLTTDSINLDANLLRVDKTWDYKYRTGFKKTKTTSSIRNISIDNHTAILLQSYLNEHHIQSPETPIFLQNGQILVSAQINKILSTILSRLKLHHITFHGLRHTHASILLFKGVSVLSVSKRLGHSNITTTQSTYLHIIKELETKDQNKIINIIDLDKI